jgi:roadblock/LC7 domain-containing protein
MTPLTDEICQWLAGELDWQKFTSDTDQAAVYYTKVTDVEAATYEYARGGWRWQLTEAGAWSALTGMKWHLFPTWSLAGEIGGTWAVRSSGDNRIGEAETPLEAVTLAVIQMYGDRNE